LLRPDYLGIFTMVDAAIKIFKQIITPVILFMGTDVELTNVTT